MIVVEDVHYQYGDAPDSARALNGVFLAVPDGQFLGIIGPNGSGKSTLGLCLSCLLTPTRGKIEVDGLDTSTPEKSWEIHKNVGMIFQNPDNQLVSTTVERELAFGLENLGLPSSEIQDRVDKALVQFDLTEYRKHAPHRLSGGQKQRLAIASVITMQPGLLICDEPTALLDPRSRTETLDLLHELHRDHKITVVYITQFPSEVLHMDRVVIMRRGEVAEDSNPREVLSDIDLLRRFALDAPPTVKLADALRRRNVPLPGGIVEPKDLIQEIRAIPSGALSEDHPESESTTPDPAGTVMELIDVDFTYSKDLPVSTPALHDVSLQIKPGSFIGLVGPNGSGKSTLMQHLNGLLTPDSGRVLIEGEDLASKETDLTSVRQRVGLIFQFPEAQLFEETVFDDVAFGPRNLGMEGDELTDRVHEALHQVLLDPKYFSHRIPFTLSAGEKRRAAFAGVLAMKPRYLILDEPTAGLDAEGTRHIEDILTRFRDSGGTVLLVSHDMDLVAALADRILVLDQGRIITDETPEAFFIKQELLESIHLQIPALMHIMSRLAAAGYPVSKSRFEIESAADEICRCLVL